jgi:hypothetical protein
MRTRLNRRGSNQFQIKGLKRKTWMNVAALTTMMFAVAYVGHEAKLHEIGYTVSPIPDRAYAMDSFIPTPSIIELAPLSEREANIALIKKIWGQDSKVGLEIARCESGYKTKGPHVANDNGTKDEGVFSINSVHGMPDMENAVSNISYAYTMYLKQGLEPWRSSNGCHHLLDK